MRERRGWSQADLAASMRSRGWTGIYQTTISRIEQGDRLPRLGEALEIASILEKPLHELLLEQTDELAAAEDALLQAEADWGAAKSEADWRALKLKEAQARVRALTKTRQG